MIDEPCVPFVADCHVRAAAELISHGWDPVVLSALRAAPLRRRELLLRIGGLSDKVLTESLRRLRNRGLIDKSGHEQAGAVYRLTALGESFATGPLLQLAQWAAEHQADLAMNAADEA